MVLKLKVLPDVNYYLKDSEGKLLRQFNLESSAFAGLPLKHLGSDFFSLAADLAGIKIKDRSIFAICSKSFVDR